MPDNNKRPDRRPIPAPQENTDAARDINELLGNVSFFAKVTLGCAIATLVFCILLVLFSTTVIANFLAAAVVVAMVASIVVVIILIKNVLSAKKAYDEMGEHRSMFDALKAPAASASPAPEPEPESIPEPAPAPEPRRRPRPNAKFASDGKHTDKRADAPDTAAGSDDLTTPSAPSPKRSEHRPRKPHPAADKPASSSAPDAPAVPAPEPRRRSRKAAPGDTGSFGPVPAGASSEDTGSFAPISAPTNPGDTGNFNPVSAPTPTPTPAHSQVPDGMPRRRRRAANHNTPDADSISDNTPSHGK